VVARVPTEALAAPPESILDRLSEARTELRVLRDRYEEDYPPIRALVREIEGLERLAQR
jgi:hypothetical protein